MCKVLWEPRVRATVWACYFLSAQPWARVSSSSKPQVLQLQTAHFSEEETEAGPRVSQFGSQSCAAVKFMVSGPGPCSFSMFHQAQFKGQDEDLKRQRLPAGFSLLQLLPPPPPALTRASLGDRCRPVPSLPVSATAKLYTGLCH